MMLDWWSKPDLLKNFFSLPNQIYSLGLEAGEIAVYGYLRSLKNQTYQCWPSYRTIGVAVCMSKNTVKKYVASLEEKRLISTEPTTVRTKNGKRNGNLRYTIRPIQEAIDCFNERQMAKLEAAVERQRAAKKLAKRDHAAPCAPPCAASEDAPSPSPTKDVLAGSGAVSEDFRGTKEQAG